MFHFLRPKSSPEKLADQIVPHLVERWLGSFDSAHPEFTCEPNTRLRAKREWVLMQLCSFEIGGLEALKDEPGKQVLLREVQNRSADVFVSRQIFSNSDEVKRLIVDRLPIYGKSTPELVGKEFENYAGLEPDLFRRLGIASTFFTSLKASTELVSGLLKSTRW